MPELPEVETVKRTLNELITGKKIEHVSVQSAADHPATGRTRSLRSDAGWAHLRGG